MRLNYEHSRKNLSGCTKFFLPSALDVLHFVEFLRLKNQSSIIQELDQKIQHGIDQTNSGLGLTIDDDYVAKINRRVQERLRVEDK